MIPRISVKLAGNGWEAASAFLGFSIIFSRVGPTQHSIPTNLDRTITLQSNGNHHIPIPAYGTTLLLCTLHSALCRKRKRFCPFFPNFLENCINYFFLFFLNIKL